MSSVDAALSLESRTTRTRRVFSFPRLGFCVSSQLYPPNPVALPVLSLALEPWCNCRVSHPCCVICHAVHVGPCVLGQDDELDEIEFGRMLSALAGTGWHSAVRPDHFQLFMPPALFQAVRGPIQLIAYDGEFRLASPYSGITL